MADTRWLPAQACTPHHAPSLQRGCIVRTGPAVQYPQPSPLRRLHDGPPCWRRVRVFGAVTAMTSTVTAVTGTVTAVIGVVRPVTGDVTRHVPWPAPPVTTVTAVTAVRHDSCPPVSFRQHG